MTYICVLIMPSHQLSSLNFKMQIKFFILRAIIDIPLRDAVRNRFHADLLVRYAPVFHRTPRVGRR